MIYKEIYLKSKKYAEAHGEIDEYEKTRKKIASCRDDMETLACSQDSLSEEDMAARRKEILDKHGVEACTFVLSATIRGNEGFVLYPRHIKQWAYDTPVSEDFDLNAAAHIDRSGSAFVTPFVEDARKRKKAERKERLEGKGGM